jgi:hypothetical protein
VLAELGEETLEVGDWPEVALLATSLLLEGVGAPNDAYGVEVEMLDERDGGVGAIEVIGGWEIDSPDQELCPGRIEQVGAGHLELRHTLMPFRRGKGRVLGVRRPSAAGIGGKNDCKHWYRKSYQHSPLPMLMPRDRRLLAITDLASYGMHPNFTAFPPDLSPRRLAVKFDDAV